MLHLDQAGAPVIPSVSGGITVLFHNTRSMRTLLFKLACQPFAVCTAEPSYTASTQTQYEKCAASGALLKVSLAVSQQFLN